MHDVEAHGAPEGLGRERTGAMEAARWYLNRLRCMTPAEISHRIVRTLSTLVEQRLTRVNDAHEAPNLHRSAHPWVHSDALVDRERYIAAANRLLGGKHDVFSLRGVDLGSPPRWNRDPKTGIEGPRTYGMRLNYRDPKLVGHIRYVWEPNRHFHLVTLAQAYALCHDVRYFALIQRHLESWIEACPCGIGPNWSSTLEPALRLVNWSIAWQLLGGAQSQPFAEPDGARLRAHWLESIHQHARFVRRHFSSYSSANNHLIGEAAGLFIAALTWPYWSDCAAWANDAAAVLEREVQRQNYGDGVNREQSVAYQQFELDLLLLAWKAGEANGRSFSAEYRSRIERMIEYLASLMDSGGHVPMIGDSDDGFAVRLSQEPAFCSYRSLLAAAALLFGRADFKAKALALDDKTRWLFGPDADASFADLDSGGGVDFTPRRAFADGGYYILGCDLETAREIRVVADAGPLGYGALAAHGHADALAITLSVGGHEILVDPGTFIYQGNRAWRDYFRGTAAHNTVRVDGLDQSQSGGEFLWLKKANAACSHWHASAERDEFEGWHDGYTRLRDPVVHRRRVTLDKRARRILIADRLSMQGTHLVEIFFHCSELCLATPRERGFDLQHSSLARPIRLVLPRDPGAETFVRNGSLAPISGWISRAFDDKRPSPTIVWRARISASTVLVTELRC